MREYNCPKCGKGVMSETGDQHIDGSVKLLYQCDCCGYKAIEKYQYIGLFEGDLFGEEGPAIAANV